MSKPNEYCGECPIYLADAECKEHCAACPARPWYVVHIPTGCCYPLEPDRETIIICGARLTPKIDGKIFWRYSDVFIEKIVTPSDPFANH